MPSSKIPDIPWQEADIAILMDSNGKFLQGEKLFPGRKTTELWCPKTRDALRILSDSSFGTPSHIIIHTGTNDLRREQERVEQMISRVAETATETYPNTKITISTLLPCRDIHPDTIQRVNADISKGFTRLPNVYLAHHPSISIRELYDHVHIRKDKVNVFAKTLKDTAWGRQTTSTPLKTTHLPTHTIQIQTPSRNTQSHHREWPPLAAQYWGPPHHAKIHFRTPHAPALHHHRPTPVHQQKPQSVPDHHPRHPDHKNTTPGRGATLRWAHHQQKPASHPLMHPQLITHWSQHHSHTPGATLRPWRDKQKH